MNFGKGLKPSTPEKVSHRVGAHLHPAIEAALAAGPKGSADLVAFRCERMDQGQSSTCFAHSVAALSWMACASAGKPLAFVPSPLCVAACTYGIERAMGSASSPMLDKLQDTGAELADAASAVSSFGVCAIAAPVPDGRYSDVMPVPDGGSFPEPDFAALEVAATHILDGGYQIAVDTNAPKTVAACLDADIPVWVGFLCDSAYENLQAGQVAVAPNKSDPSAGGHAEYISAYRTNAAGKLEFRVENSWGSGWCDNGFCWASEEWLMATWDLWPWPVQEAT